MDGGRVRQLLSDAKSHADVGDMLLASQLYTRATEIDPENAAAWYGLGVVQISRGFPDESVHAFEKANSLDSEHAPTAADAVPGDGHRVLYVPHDGVRATLVARRRRQLSLAAAGHAGRPGHADGLRRGRGRGSAAAPPTSRRGTTRGRRATRT